MFLLATCYLPEQEIVRWRDKKKAPWTPHTGPGPAVRSGNVYVTLARGVTDIIIVGKKLRQVLAGQGNWAMGSFN